MVICDPQYIEKRLKGKGHWFTSTLYLLGYNDLVKFLMATVAVKSLYEWQLCHLHREDEVVRWTGTFGEGGGLMVGIDDALWYWVMVNHIQP